MLFNPGHFHRAVCLQQEYGIEHRIHNPSEQTTGFARKFENFTAFQLGLGGGGGSF